MTPLSDALAALRAATRPIEPTTSPVADAVGAVLSEALVATGPAPPASIALRPGFPLAAAATQGATPYSPLPWSEPFLPVSAGSPLPPGTDALLPEAAVTMGLGVPEIGEEAAPGQWVRRSGGDLAAGAVIRAAGAKVRTIDVAVAEAAGLGECRVRRPCLALLDLSGGSARIVSATARLGGAAVEPCRDLAAWVASLRTDRVHLGIAVGPPAAIEPALAADGWRPIAEALALRPGEDARLGCLAGTPVVIVPDRPEAALAVCLALLAPLLADLTDAAGEPPSLPMPLTRKITSTIGLTEIALLRSVEAGLELIAVADLPWSALAAADHWLAVSPDSEGFARGEQVRARRL